MSSTDHKAEKLLSTFYVEQFTPAAECARQRGVQFLDTNRSSEGSTYFEKCEQQALFQQIEPETCQAIVVEIWHRANLPELVELAPQLFALAPQVTPKVEDEDVSPFMYVMF